MALAPFWTRWGGEDKEGWRYQFSEKNAPADGEFLGRRYAGAKNIIWILGGDANPPEVS